MFTSSQTSVNAFRALRRSEFSASPRARGAGHEQVYAKYFEDTGIGVVAMEGMGVESVYPGGATQRPIAAFLKRLCDTRARMPFTSWLVARGASVDCGRWNGAGLPVVQRSRAHLGIQKRLHVPRADQGLWRLLETSRIGRAEQAGVGPHPHLMIVRYSKVLSSPAKAADPVPPTELLDARLSRSMTPDSFVLDRP